MDLMTGSWVIDWATSCVQKSTWRVIEEREVKRGMDSWSFDGTGVSFDNVILSSRSRSALTTRRTGRKSKISSSPFRSILRERSD